MDVSRETEVAAAALFGERLPLAVQYAEALSSSGVERGLIGPREVPRIWERHLLNCVAVAPLIPAAAEVADVGSGAGLPGLVLALARPDLQVSLVEPLLRRVTWLEEVVASLGLTNVELIRARAGAVAESRMLFDVVTARAVAGLPTLVGWCLPLVKPDGLFLALKGESAAAELVETEPLLREHGAVEWSVVSVGESVLEVPTRVVRVVAGARSTGGGAAKRGASKRGSESHGATGRSAGSRGAEGSSAAGQGSKAGGRKGRGQSSRSGR